MKRFEEDIDSLIEQTVYMGRLTTDMIEKAVHAFCEGDVDLAEEVEDDFGRIIRYDAEIEDLAIKIMTLFQPTAIDVRTIVTVLKSITYMERIAKYSKNIAIATRYLADKPSFEPVETIRPMGETVVKMVKIVTRGFENRSVEDFDKLTEMDDYLDRTMREDLRSIIQFIDVNKDSADVCTYYISVLKFLERCGDHACKMAEKVNFMVTGMHATIS